MRFTLVHSPLVGALTWAGVGAELQARGHDAVIASIDDTEPCDVLVGHSGAGPWLPIIAARCEVSPALVFVDAPVPPTAGVAALIPTEFYAHLARLAVDGMLPKWSEWFGSGVMETLVPDAELRAELVGEMPELPLAYFDQVLHLPPHWSDARCGYVLLSAPYNNDAAESRLRGWPVVELDSTHLGIVTDPPAVTSALLQVSGPA